MLRSRFRYYHSAIRAGTGQKYQDMVGFTYINNEAGLGWNQART